MQYEQAHHFHACVNKTLSLPTARSFFYSVAEDKQELAQKVQDWFKVFPDNLAKAKLSKTEITDDEIRDTGKNHFDIDVYTELFAKEMEAAKSFKIDEWANHPAQVPVRMAKFYAYLLMPLTTGMVAFGELSQIANKEYFERVMVKDYVDNEVVFLEDESQKKAVCTFLHTVYYLARATTSLMVVHVVLSEKVHVPKDIRSYSYSEHFTKLLWEVAAVLQHYRWDGFIGRQTVIDEAVSQLKAVYRAILEDKSGSTVLNPKNVEIDDTTVGILRCVCAMDQIYEQTPYQLGDLASKHSYCYGLGLWFRIIHRIADKALRSGQHQIALPDRERLDEMELELMASLYLSEDMLDEPFFTDHKRGGHLHRWLYHAVQDVQASREGKPRVKPSQDEFTPSQKDRARVVEDARDKLSGFCNNCCSWCCPAE